VPKSSEIMKEKTGTVVGIQYLRAFAAMSVVWFHALRASPEILQRLNDSYFAGTGVPLFFVISGFIMVMTTAKGMSPSKFMELRIIRVVPLYWLWTLFLVALTLIAPHMLKRVHPTPIMVVKSLLFIPYVSPDFDGMVAPVLLQGWTLNYEMFFYALFALSLCLTRFRLEVMTGALLLLVGIGYAFGPFHWALPSVYTSGLLLDFVAGMWIARGWLSGYKVPLWTSALMMPAGLWMLGLPSYWIAIGAAVLVIGCLRITTRVVGLLALGDASYSIYLVHPFILSAFERLWRHHFGDLGTLFPFLICGCAACAVGGWLCYRLIERPMTAALRRFRAGKSGQMRPASSPV
jgi:exopolysaccharide production protein ExoZ